jgi:anti-anti-sigma factor
VEASASSESRLRVSHHAGDDEVVVELVGELDVASTPAFEDYVMALRPVGAPLTLEVTQLTFVDSSGLRGLAVVRRAAIEDTGSAVTLAGCSNMLRKLLELTGMAGAFAGVDCD